MYLNVRARLNDKKQRKIVIMILRIDFVSLFFNFDPHIMIRVTSSATILHNEIIVVWIVLGVVWMRGLDRVLYFEQVRDKVRVYEIL